jgi:hypothetical protein
LEVGYEFELGLSGKRGPLGNGRAKTDRVWVRDSAELQRVMDWRLSEIRKEMAPPTFKTDPFVLPIARVETPDFEVVPV